MPKISLARTLLFFFKEKKESSNGINNNKGASNTVSPGKRTQLKGLSKIIKTKSSKQINNVITDVSVNLLLLFL